MVKGLLCNREVLSLDPRHPRESQEQQHLSVTLVPELVSEPQREPLPEKTRQRVTEADTSVG